MKAKVKYNDLIGTSAGDMEDIYSIAGNMKLLHDKFKLDPKEIEIVGFNIYYPDSPNYLFNLICIDKRKTPNVKVKILVDNIEEDFLNTIFKRLSITLINKHNKLIDTLDDGGELHLSKI